MIGCAGFIGVGLGGSAWAQRADDNATAAAEDAYGTRIGSDNVGLYSPNSARGFNPMQAGNVRLEGLYFDQQAFLGRAIAKSTTMRVGLSAQSYPFPAPTGIADTAISTPAEKIHFSFSEELRRPTGLNLNYAEASGPLTDTLSGLLAVSTYQAWSPGRARGSRWTVASTARWKPSDKVEVAPFVFYQRGEDDEVQPSIYTAGAFLPPKYDRGVFYGQEWADRASDDLNYGLLVRGTPWANWRLQAGIFGSDAERASDYVVYFRNVQPNGVGNLEIQKYPWHDSKSLSGEVRASGVYASGSFRHTIHIATRARDTRRVFGGGNTLAFGPATIGVYKPVAEPRFNYGIADKDVVQQITPGVSYAGQWANVGEFSVGLQKGFYHRSYGKVGSTPATTRSQPWLYNATMAYYATRTLALYGSYTRGLEEFGTAPETAANGGAPLPAGLTRQIDAGVRYTIMPGFTAVVGVFEVKKPYFDRDTANFYTVVGDLSHKGVEFSLTGKPFTGLTVVAGAVFLKARVSGLTVDQGIIGKVAPGTSPRFVSINLQYSAPTWKGFTLEAQADSNGSTMANRANTLRVPAVTTYTLGARYPFVVMGVNVSMRAQVVNVTNVFGWTVDGSAGRFTPNGARQFGLRIAADY